MTCFLNEAGSTPVRVCVADEVLTDSRDGDFGSPDDTDVGAGMDLDTGSDTPADANDLDQLLEDGLHADSDAAVADGHPGDAFIEDLVDLASEADGTEDAPPDMSAGDETDLADLVDSDRGDALEPDVDLGCTGDEACQDGAFCNGVERCIDGSCQPGEEPEEPDAWSCTEARCDEELDRITHDRVDANCAVANVCLVGACQPQLGSADPSSGCVELPAPYATTCGDGLACRGVECVLDGCGNDVVEWVLGEECDDGGRASGDGCSTGCAWEYSVLDLGASVPDLRITGVDDGDGWGNALTCADVNADGIDDLIAWTSEARGESNANAEDTPEIRVVFGPIPLTGEASLASLTDWVIYGVQPSESLWDQEAVTVRVDDIDGDGRADLIADAPELDDAELVDVGAVLAYLSSTAGGIDHLTRGDADVALVGADEFVNLSYAGLLNVEGDEAREILSVSRHVQNGTILRRSTALGSRFLPDPDEAAYLLPDTGEADVYLFGAHVVRGGTTSWLVTEEAEWSGVPGLSDQTNSIVRWLARAPWPDEPTLLTSFGGTVLAGAPASAGVSFAGSSDLNGDRQPDVILAEAGATGEHLYLVDGALLVEERIDVTEPTPGSVLLIHTSWVGTNVSLQTVTDLDGNGRA